MSENSPAPTPSASTTQMGARIRNFLIVVVAIVLSTTLFLSLGTQTGSTTLTNLAETSTPLEVALTNQKPTLMEFYANWCTSCQAMAKDMGELEQQYAGKVNFVMLNVDNTKWLPEILHYRVEGIPHFVFLDTTGEAIASAIGEQPRTVMAANLEALATATPLPYAKVSGQVSNFNAPIEPQAASDPRSHGSQVVNGG